MTADLEAASDWAVALCLAAHERLRVRIENLSEDVMRIRSRLPDWSVGHVLTHLARNADAHARRLDGALRGQDVPKYAGGAEQRSAEIDGGARRPAGAIIADLVESQTRLNRLFAACSEAGWPNQHFGGTAAYGPHACPAHRLREVEMHHVDLGLGYEPRDWPSEYVAWELPILLETLPHRLREDTARRELLAWLAGRGGPPTAVQLDAWG
jgi:maleylpyruvate isomerase